MADHVTASRPKKKKIMAALWWEDNGDRWGVRKCNDLWVEMGKVVHWITLVFVACIFSFNKTGIVSRGKKKEFTIIPFMDNTMAFLVIYFL